MESIVFNATVQPIIDLDTERQERCGELLYRGNRFPETQDEWRRWYQYLEKRAIELFFEHRLHWMTINLNTEHILDDVIMGSIEKLSAVPLILEWTEVQHAAGDAALSEAAVRIKRVAQQHHYQVALDDIGAGEDGMRRLSFIHPDWVKIDGSLFKMACQSPRVADLLGGFIDTYRKADIEVVIEWVEDAKDLTLACAINANRIQGFIRRTFDELDSRPLAPIPGRALSGDDLDKAKRNSHECDEQT